MCRFREGGDRELKQRQPKWGPPLFETEMEQGSSNEEQYPHNVEVGCSVCAAQKQELEVPFVRQTAVRPDGTSYFTNAIHGEWVKIASLTTGQSVTVSYGYKASGGTSSSEAETRKSAQSRANDLKACFSTSLSASVGFGAQAEVGGTGVELGVGFSSTLGLKACGGEKTTQETSVAVGVTQLTSWGQSVTETQSFSLSVPSQLPPGVPEADTMQTLGVDVWQWEWTIVEGAHDNVPTKWYKSKADSRFVFSPVPTGATERRPCCMPGQEYGVLWYPYNCKTREGLLPGAEDAAHCQVGKPGSSAAAGWSAQAVVEWLGTLGTSQSQEYWQNVVFDRKLDGRAADSLLRFVDESPASYSAVRTVFGQIPTGDALLILRGLIELSTNGEGGRFVPRALLASAAARLGQWALSERGWATLEGTFGGAAECAVALQLLGSLRWGAAIQRRRGESLQARVALSPCTAAEHTAVAGQKPSVNAEADERLWCMVAPDGGVYPHELTVQALRIVVPNDMTDHRQLPNRGGANPAGLGAYGQDWGMTPAEFCLQMRIAMGRSLEDVIARGLTALPPAAGPEEEVQALAPASPRIGSGSGLLKIPSEWAVGRDKLPYASPSGWRCVASSDGDGNRVLGDVDFETFVITSGFGIGRRRSGPRMAKWVCEFVRENEVTFRSRHAKFKAETGLSSSDQDVSIHALCCRIMHLLLTFDQLSASELACAELVCRRLQMAEYWRRDRIHSTSRGDELLEDARLYPGTGEARGLICIAPSLLTFVADELHKESMVLKGRRKLKEERMASRGDANSGSGGGDHQGRLAGMQSTADRQKSEIDKLKKQLAGAPKGDARSRGRRGLAVDLWTCEVIAALNFLNGRVGGGGYGKLSAAQLADVDSLRDRVSAFGAPDIGPAAACRGSARQCADFLRDLFEAGMINFTSERKHALAPLFVAKRDGGGERRMALDARRVNRMFYDPDVAELPTAGSWQSLRLEADSSLYLGQCDIEAAFYRFLAPAGLSELMILPSIDRVALASVLPAGALDDTVSRNCSPCLKVLPMGWNWSLFFCQHTVEGMLGAVGFGDAKLVRDRKVIPDLATGPVSAAYVDGVAVIGTQYDEVVDQLSGIYGAFNDGGLKWKEMELPSQEQKFTGLIFDRDLGRISLGPAWMWKIRQALLCRASQPCASGSDLSSLVGHFNWASPLRRPLPCIFQSAYRFIQKVRVAAALVAFAYYDAKRPADAMVYCTGACTGDLDPRGSLFGGYGVTKREVEISTVIETARVRERWRYQVEGAINARDFAFANRDAPAEQQASFATVSSELVFPMGSRRNVTFGRRSRDENILRLEARAKAAGRLELARQKANRAKLRAAKFGGINCNPRCGLTFLQRRKVRAAAISGFDKHVASFLEWAEAPSLEAITADRLDVLLAGYLDKLLWGGELAGAGSRLLASVQCRLPRVPRPKHGGLPLARAALSGFRVHSRSAPMMPVGKPIVWAMIGTAALEGDFEWAGALALAWVGMIRLPSDLVDVTTETLVGPGRGAVPRWARLLYPIEGSTRSRTLLQDEGALLRGTAWRGGGGSFLRQLRRVAVCSELVEADISSIRGDQRRPPLPSFLEGKQLRSIQPCAASPAPVVRRLGRRCSRRGWQVPRASLYRAPWRDTEWGQLRNRRADRFETWLEVANQLKGNCDDQGKGGRRQGGDGGVGEAFVFELTEDAPDRWAWVTGKTRVFEGGAARAARFPERALNCRAGREAEHLRQSRAALLERSGPARPAAQCPPRAVRRDGGEPRSGLRGAGRRAQPRRGAGRTAGARAAGDGGGPQ
ncbi:unnamed protein product, partial [Prorocentrum cordatum]